MRRFRLHIPGLVAAWLVCQGVALLVAPVALQSGTAVVDGGDCDCPGARPGQFCPMHQSPNRAEHREGTLALQNACSPTDAALISLGIGLGVLPASNLQPAERQLGAIVVLPIVSLTRSELPDSPPPRV
jgi:hypothetical protein